ncbi:MAG TPA: ATP-binding protein [Micromonosporaceae bacterium]
MSEDQLTDFGRLFTEFLHRSLERVPDRPRSDLLERLQRHLGVDPVGLPVVSEPHPAFDHANVRVALEAYASSPGRSAELLGVGGHGRMHHSLSELLEAGRHGQYGTGAVDYVSVAVGPERELTVVNFGLYLISDGDARLAVLLRGSAEQYGRPSVDVEVLAADPADAQRLLAGVRDELVRHNIFRGQIVSFEPHEFGHGVGPLRFHARPTLAADDVVLPHGRLETVERQILGVARHRAVLHAAGHPLKRGILLFGPPGTGKTHTVRYLLAQLPDFTAVLLSGMGLHFIQQACALARFVQPALIVLEDVDLIASSRDMRPGMDNPLLYQVLNEIDGLAGDADVAFLLTTNRADLLEEALAERPGRVDLAVEVPLPDAAARAALLRLYGRDIALTAAEVDAIVAATDGATASFFTELARRAALLAATEGESPGAGHVRRALAELQASQAALAAAR